ncbi:TlpA family protein disulfide reductase [Tropicibacter naphthalenivorans]|uniref:Cytochrome c biogenesis protein TlpA n=1 Tax=Tropicibacter naphthalenivorans TaxID=441103 RepID=A0A0P1GEK6_9RHOB|nr:TlpA disulfide reductase family protein [Tropicibacter naphthalenivorans]CUH79862.1 Cytochrome c biogenesis protein TlpA [Tropicibacter naphthalenivorans]SMC75768.1 Thiol-disulfide isomerase or thioredoxin [Tropicibacter naphthalenivorans]
MKKFGLALLYTATMALANPVVADVAAAQAAVAGDMKKLSFSEPQPVGDGVIVSFDGEQMNLSESNGKWRVVNFWATWCAPCRHEMPMLSQLQSDLGGEEFEVITIATSRNPPAKMKAFFDEIGVDNLPLHRDPKSYLARQIGVLGLPVTLILNPEGQEVARLTGDADWASDEAKAVIKALMSGS